MAFNKISLLERLKTGPVVGDGSMVVLLEKRGYCTPGIWTPEAVMLYPEAVREILREYIHAGADVITTPCFYSSDARLRRGNKTFTAADINEAACKMAKEVAKEGRDVLVCGGLSPVEAYTDGKGEAAVKEEFEEQLKIFIKHDVDFVLAEFFAHVEEIEMCIDVMKKAGKPIAASMRIGPMGDFNGISVEDCALRMAKAGADVVGTNCMFDINTQLKTLRRMKDALEKAGLNREIMCQPPGYLCPEVENTLYGQPHLPEGPLLFEPRLMTRFEVHEFARAAFEQGIKYIGGCCATEPHHIRAIAQELAPERMKDPPSNDMCPPYGVFLPQSDFLLHRNRNTKEYWRNLQPGSGRPYNSPLLKF
ncbi:unnamed protein product [Clavelina lepadiformis]|uniref:Hcy-binding domain-containing protein n=1 Tax=Clavelina lepadiformis TaxID=159417 RepID=A0ABP0GZL9_CLALP